MVHWPILTQPETVREVTDVFLGYNANLRIQPGEFAEMENLTSDFFPLMAPRQGRQTYAQPQHPQGLIAKDCLCYVDGSRFVMNGYATQLGLSIGEHPKQLVSMGAYVVIFPDKKYINTADLTDFGSLEAEFTWESAQLIPCNAQGEEKLPDYIQPAEPAAPQGGQLWLDTSQQDLRLRQWSSSLMMWVEVTQTFVKISAPGIGNAFGPYDGVQLSGDVPQRLLGSTTVYSCEHDWIVVGGLLDRPADSAGGTVRRRVPDMDYVIESGNRLWGCRYGTDGDGAIVNTIYASKLGDFRNWNSFLGLSTDSYAVSLGSDGPFTGAIAHMGYPLFFREGCLHRIYGSTPATFQLQTIPCRGVQRGSSRSLAIVGETLYYQSPRGVCAFDGSLPRDVSHALGNLPYGSGAAAALGQKYYLSTRRTDTGEMCLLVYDTGRQLWHRESGLNAAILCTCDNKVYAMERSSIVCLSGGEEAVSWMAQTGMLGGNDSQAGYLTGLSVRMALSPGAWVHFAVRYDSMGPWEPVGDVVGRGTGSFTVPLRPHRCDHLHLRLTGKGDARIFAITATRTEGSDAR